VPVEPGEAEAVAAFVHGNLLAQAHQGIAGLAVDRIDQDTDEEGTYRPWFTVVTASGIRIRVIITPEDTP
jgi:hypothetical protein